VVKFIQNQNAELIFKGIKELLITFARNHSCFEKYYRSESIQLSSLLKMAKKGDLKLKRIKLAEAASGTKPFSRRKIKLTV